MRVKRARGGFRMSESTREQEVVEHSIARAELRAALG